jgi:hypothetical protein
MINIILRLENKWDAGRMRRVGKRMGYLWVKCAIHIKVHYIYMYVDSMGRPINTVSKERKGGGK